MRDHDVLCVDKLKRMADPLRVVALTTEALKRYPLREYAPVLRGLLAQWLPVAMQLQAPLTTVDTVMPLARAPYVLCNCAKHDCEEHKARLRGAHAARAHGREGAR